LLAYKHVIGGLRGIAAIVIVMAEEDRFILHTTRPGQQPAAVAFTKEVVAFSHTLTAARSGEFERVVLLRDVGNAHHVIFDSARDPDVTGEGNGERGGAAPAKEAAPDKGGKKDKKGKQGKKPKAPKDWRARLSGYITCGLILLVIALAVNYVLNG
jgi:hypothetical protein